jgi:hypothetical protein
VGRLKLRKVYIQCIECNEMVPIKKADYKFVHGLSMSYEDYVATCHKCDCPHFIVGFEL